MNLEGIMLNEINKNVAYNLHVEAKKKKNELRETEQTGGCQRRGIGAGGTG